MCRHLRIQLQGVCIDSSANYTYVLLLIDSPLVAAPVLLVSNRASCKVTFADAVQNKRGYLVNFHEIIVDSDLVK